VGRANLWNIEGFKFIAMCRRNIKFNSYVNGVGIGGDYTNAKLVYFGGKPNINQVYYHVERIFLARVSNISASSSLPICL
jgi:hypothetical protein